MEFSYIRTRDCLINFFAKHLKMAAAVYQRQSFWLVICFLKSFCAIKRSLAFLNDRFGRVSHVRSSRFPLKCSHTVARVVCETLARLKRLNENQALLNRACCLKKSGFTVASIYVIRVSQRYVNTIKARYRYNKFEELLSDLPNRERLLKCVSPRGKNYTRDRSDFCNQLAFTKWYELYAMVKNKGRFIAKY